MKAKYIATCRTNETRRMHGDTTTTAAACCPVTISLMPSPRSMTLSRASSSAITCSETHSAWSESKHNLHISATPALRSSVCWTLKVCIARYEKPIAELRSVAFHMGSHSVSCRPTQAGFRFTYHGGMEGWVIYRDGSPVRRQSPI